MRIRSWLLVVGLALVAAPGTAQADGLLTPFAGVVFGGDAEITRPTFGAGVGFMVGGRLGVESEFSYTPDFFDVEDETLEINVRAMMVSVLLGIPLQRGDYAEHAPGIRPYVAAGLGIMTTPAREREFGFNAGGGVMVFLNPTIGFRGDFRYLRSLENPEIDNIGEIDVGDFEFMRVYGGLIVRF
jgi:hypothetical protein